MRETIRRLGVTRRWSDSVIHGNTVYLVEVPPDPLADPESQIQALLESVDQQLMAAGSDRTHLLMATIYLKDFAFLERFNLLWEAWLPASAAPARACVRAEMAHPGYVAELAIIAATK